jgi:predicted RNase H-like HicB family nuclease
MRNEFTAVIEQDGDWYIAYSPEIPDLLARKICRGLSVPEFGR